MARFSPGSAGCFALLGALCLPLPARADPAEQAWTAAGADAATTAAALSAGLAQFNPVGPLGAMAIKGAVMGYIQSQPAQEQTAMYHMASSAWAGAAANNLCWIAGAGPVCLLLGALASHWFWQAGEPERQQALALSRPGQGFTEAAGALEAPGVGQDRLAARAPQQPAPALAPHVGASDAP